MKLDCVNGALTGSDSPASFNMNSGVQGWLNKNLNE